MNFFQKFINSLFGKILTYGSLVTIILTATIIIYSAINPEKSKKVYEIYGVSYSEATWSAILGLLATVFFALIVHFLENFGALHSIEKNIDKKISNIEKNMSNTINARFNYGLTSVDYKGDYDINIIKRLQETKQPTEIFWLNTYINNLADLIEIFPVLVKDSDISFQLLLMSVDNNNVSYRGKYTRQIMTESDYIDELVRQEKYMYSVKSACDQMIDRRGSFDVKFYRYTPHFPMFIVKEKVIGGHEEAHTGFFINKPSSAAPYLTWTSHLGGGFIKDLDIYFQHLWEQEDNHPPRSPTEVDKSKGIAYEKLEA